MKTIKRKSELRVTAKSEEELRVKCYLTLPLAGEMVRVVPNLRVVKIPQSIRRARKAVKLLEENKIKLETSYLRGAPPKYPPRVVALVHEARRDGKTLKRISRELEIPKSSVRYILAHRGLKT